MIKLVNAAVFSAAMVMLALVRLHSVAPDTLACSIGTVTLEQAVREADAAAVVYVESVRGPENNAARVTPLATVQSVTSSRTRPVDLTGYGATLRVYSPVFGQLPPQFDVDLEVRQEMERGLRMIEAGVVPPCPVDLAIAHYLAGQYYVVLLEKTEPSWKSYLTFNYRVEGSDLLTSKVYEQERREWAGPWPIEMKRPLHDRFFAATGRKVYPSINAPPGVVVALDDEIWRLDGQRVSLGAFVEALRYARTQPSIRPPNTGDGALQR